jgi:hypothetical protein
LHLFAQEYLLSPSFSLLLLRFGNDHLRILNPAPSQIDFISFVVSYRPSASYLFFHFTNIKIMVMYPNMFVGIRTQTYNLGSVIAHGLFSFQPDLGRYCFVELVNVAVDVFEG